MRRIVLLTFDYPPNNGGIARLCFEIIKELSKRNIPYLVITNIPDKNDKQDPNVVRIIAKRGLLELKLINYIYRNTSSDDLFICDTWHPAGMLCVLMNRKTYILAHGAEYLQGNNYFRKVIWAKYRLWVLNRSKGIIANSHYTKKLVEKTGAKTITTAIPLAIDAEKFYPTVTKKRTSVLKLCSLSRIEQFKGHDFILRTIASLPERYRNRIEFEIGGKGPYLSELKKLTNSLHLDGIVKFLGFVPEESLCDFYSSNDVYILCTREENEQRNVEGFGLVFVEAQACGIAVIGTNSGGIPDAIKPNQGGWLIQQDSVQELSKLLIQLIDNPLLVIEQGDLARKRVVKECNWHIYMDAFLNFIVNQ